MRVLRPNSTLAVVYDLKVFFTVIDVDPLDVRRRDVLEFIRVQRTGSADATVIPIDQPNGLALSTIRRRMSTLAGFYSHLVALGELDHNPVQRGLGGAVAAWQLAMLRKTRRVRLALRCIGRDSSRSHTAEQTSDFGRLLYAVRAVRRTGRGQGA